MGARLVFRETAASTRGELLRVDFFLEPRGVIAEEHLHPVQRERFEVVRGQVTGRIDGIEMTVATGEASEIAAGARHCWWNSGTDEAQLLLEFRPALRTEGFFERVFALAREGRTDEHGVPSLSQKFVLLLEYGAEFIPGRVPKPVARGWGAASLALGRLRGS